MWAAREPATISQKGHTEPRSSFSIYAPAMTGPLERAVAVVTGGSRGIGKGIATELGAAGATVYVTGRTVAAGPLPGTVAVTAEQVTALGGPGIAMPCDHEADAPVQAPVAHP